MAPSGAAEPAGDDPTYDEPPAPEPAQQHDPEPVPVAEADDDDTRRYLEPAAATLARRRSLLGLPAVPDGPSEFEERMADTTAETEPAPVPPEQLEPEPALSPPTIPIAAPIGVAPVGPLIGSLDAHSGTHELDTGAEITARAAPSPAALATDVLSDRGARMRTDPAPSGVHVDLPHRTSTSALVESISERVGELYGVGDTAQLLADEIVEIADADAAAVLVPDGGLWRVSGGVGLRPSERRLVLDAGHWLVAEIAIGGRALLVEDTDIVRPKLAGAPLAAWRHLLAVPIPEVRSAVVLARGYEAGAFSEQDLTALVQPVRRSVSMMRSALMTRQLARLLAPLRESDPLH